MKENHKVKVVIDDGDEEEVEEGTLDEEASDDLDEDFGEEEYGVGMRKGDAKMVDAFNKAYDELKAEGKLAEISTKWFGEDITC